MVTPAVSSFTPKAVVFIAANNGNDAIGILQTADKAMDEQLKILDTIKTKATQAAQDGQSLKTRTMLQA
ncbi:hypothetical protein, partial [Campylobacter jejuni]|uniref:flagellin N-terminal helical domain-containing protein n=1 Tax=Campylobacter jejuni TaxID=197 RepID=UPI003F510A33